MVQISMEKIKHLPRNRKNRLPKINYLYFILDKDQNAVKIGISKDPQTRLADFRIHNLNELELLISVPFPRKNIKKVEKDFHELFKGYLIRNERFRYSSNIKVAIGVLKGANKKVKGQKANG